MYHSWPSWADDHQAAREDPSPCTQAFERTARDRQHSVTSRSFGILPRVFAAWRSAGCSWGSRCRCWEVRSWVPEMHSSKSFGAAPQSARLQVRLVCITIALFTLNIRYLSDHRCIRHISSPPFRFVPTFKRICFTEVDFTWKLLCKSKFRKNNIEITH